MKDEMEDLLGLGKIQTGKVLPGSQLNEGREFLYVSCARKDEFALFFKKLVRKITPPIPKNGGAIDEGCRILLPDGEVFHAISYKGDLAGWRLQIKAGADALGVSVARLVGTTLVVDDNGAIELGDCLIEFD